MAAVSSSVPEREYSVDSRLMLSLSWASARGKASLAELWMDLVFSVVGRRRVVEESGIRAFERRTSGDNIFSRLKGGCWIGARSFGLLGLWLWEVTFNEGSQLLYIGITLLFAYYVPFKRFSSFAGFYIRRKLYAPRCIWSLKFGRAGAMHLQ